VVATFLAPILPALAARARGLFGAADAGFDALSRPLPASIRPYEPLLTRIDPAQVKAMVEASKEDLKPAAATLPATKASSAKSTTGMGGDAPAATTPASAPAPASTVAPTIGIDDFARLDLRVGVVLECGFVEGSDKLLRFRLDAGELGERQIFSGIRGSYGEPEALVGRKVVFIANLAPRKMRFGVSQGMILSAGDERGLFLLDADAGAAAGMPVK
jgi:methionyl-tRNA synthetase